MKLLRINSYKQRYEISREYKGLSFEERLEFLKEIKELEKPKRRINMAILDTFDLDFSLPYFKLDMVLSNRLFSIDFHNY